MAMSWNELESMFSKLGSGSFQYSTPLIDGPPVVQPSMWSGRNTFCQVVGVSISLYIAVSRADLSVSTIGASFRVVRLHLMGLPVAGSWKAISEKQCMQIQCNATWHNLNLH